jgi:hypothetical protein
VKKSFWQVIFWVCFFLKVECAPTDSNGDMRFLSDGEAGMFFEKFLQNRGGGDFIFCIKIETSSKQHGCFRGEGVILHHRTGGNSSYYVEITDEAGNRRKFLLKNGAIGTNFVKNFNSDEPFIPGSLYTPNDLLLPFLNKNCRFKYCGPKKICGRTTQQFIIATENSSAGPTVKFAKVSIDSAFWQILEIDYLGDGQKFLSRQRVLSLRKRGDHWLPKALEFLDGRTRERTKVIIVDFDFETKLQDEFFKPDFCLKNSPPGEH